MGKLRLIIFLLIIAAAGYWTYTYIKKTNKQPVTPNVPLLTAPVNQAQNSVDNYSNKAQQDLNKAQQLPSTSQYQP